MDILTPVFVDRVPTTLEDDKIYISEECEVAVHLCPCGCKEKVVTSLGPDGWQLKKHTGGAISLYPSIGNFQFKCKSHYFILQNRVVRV